MHTNGTEVVRITCGYDRYERSQCKQSMCENVPRMWKQIGRNTDGKESKALEHTGAKGLKTRESADTTNAISVAGMVKIF